MAYNKELHKKAVNKYRREKTKIFQLQYPTAEHKRIMAYAKHINMPATTWIKQLITDAINADTTFHYVPDVQEEGDQE